MLGGFRPAIYPGTLTGALARFERAGIEIPYPYQRVLVRISPQG
jgi:hypothetical protein